MWNKNKNSNEINKIREECEKLQDSIDLDSSDSTQINNFFQMQSKLSNSLHIEAANLQWKAKVNWPTSGDMPSKFVYAKMSVRKYCNDIGKLHNGNGTIINDAPI